MSSSSSTSSSSSFSYSTDSSYSSNSSSSHSTSSSSSSSLDSSSTSSESIGNVSSSSSSSAELWNRAKPFVLANTAISKSLIKNRLAQTVHLLDSTYEIGNVYVYLMGPYGKDDSYQLNMDIYSCDDDGKPLTQISSKTINGSSVTSNGWYAFEFNISGSTPSNGYLSFVMWQNGGDEDNYTMWAYNYYTNSSTSSEVFNKAWISNDNSTWVADWNVSRSLRLTGSYEAFNLVDYQVETPPSSLKTTNLSLGGRSPIYTDTKIDGGNLTLDYPDIITSFVVDNSGSTGWSDRFRNRHEIVGDIVSRLQQHYPSDVLFDFVTFGAKVANASSVNANLGQVMTINLDANSPTRATYIFDTSSATAYKGDIYTSNSSSFTVAQNVSNSSYLICLGDGTPEDEGELQISSGSGDATISYSGYESALDVNEYIAYGFKNLENGHNYIIGQLALDNAQIAAPNLSNWQSYCPASENPSVNYSETGGPDETNAVSISATSNVVFRKPFTNAELLETYLTSNVSSGDVSVSVEDASIFTVGHAVDLLNGDVASFGHVTQVASNVLTNTLYFEEVFPARYDILDKTANKGRAQISISERRLLLDGTTLQLLVKDPTTDGSTPVTFYMQTVDGKFLEWDFIPFEDWIYSNLFWLDESAILPVTIYDSNGLPFPDGTKVVLEVDGRNTLDELKENAYIATLLTRDASSGDVKIYVKSTQGYSVNQVVDIMENSNKIESITIKEIGEDSNGYYVKFYEPLSNNYLVNNNAKIIKNDKGSSKVSENSLISASLSTVDVTPIVTQKSLNPSLLQDYDLTPVSPSDTYDSININRTYIQNGSINMPTIDGYASARILPITEDILRTNEEKDSISENILKGKPTTIYTDQIEENDGDFDSISVSNASATDANTVIGDDYVIQSPIYLQEGYAESSMYSSATDLELTNFKGFNIPGIAQTNGSTALFAKTYTIYPAVIEETDNGTIKALQYFDEFETSFAAPISIHSNKGSQYVGIWCEKFDDDGICSYFEGYEKENYYGQYVGDGPFTIEYTVANKGILIDNEYLTIRVYSNVVDSQDEVANTLLDKSAQSTQKINIIYDPVNVVSNGVSTVTQELSDIDTWRETVSENPVGSYIESTTEEENIPIDYDIGSEVVNQLLNSDYYSNLLSIGQESDKKLEEYPFYQDALKWTNATQYSVYETNILLENGKATFTIPENDTAAMLFVEASFPFGDGRYESIRDDLIFIANPLSIGGLVPTFINPTGEPDDFYEIGGTITWKDGSAVIEDNTTVNFTPKETPAQPSVSATADGWAGGVLLGPHDEVIFESATEEASEGGSGSSVICPPKSVTEYVDVEIVHSSGYKNTVKRRIEWRGVQIEDSSNKFYFHVSGSGSGWADGSEGSSTIITANLQDGINELPLWVGSDGILRLQGYNQFENLPRYINASTLIPSRTRWNANGGPLTFEIQNLNQNIGNHPKIYGNSVYAPWDREVTMTTSYKDSGGKNKSGYGLTNLPSLTAEGDLFYPVPISYSEEPLAISIDIESYNDSFSRDGVDTANIVATVAWKGNPITNKFILNEGSDNESTIDYPFPMVRFEIGECLQVNSTQDKNPQYIDYRGDFGGCLKIKKHSDANLSDYTVQASLSRTDIYTDGGNSHTHKCSVDDNGNGKTTSLIILSGSVSNHTHTISDYEATTANGHTHDLRCVAVTELQPTTNTSLDIYINGYAEYDPTNCSAYKGDGLSLSPVPMPTTGNRMMFSTYTVPGYIATSPQLVIDLTVQPYGNVSSNVASSTLPTFYAAYDPDETERGFDIVANAYFSSYTTEIVPGFPVTIPNRAVDDGSRLSMDIKVFRPEPNITIGEASATGSGIKISGPDIISDYMIIKVKASIASEGLYGESEATIEVDSNLSWLPDVRGLVTEPTSDEVYIDNSVAYSANVGSSQIYDAIRMAAQRLISYQNDYPSYKDYKKTILLLTDGDENSSEYSLDKSINNVTFINGYKETQVIPISLGRLYSGDNVILQKLYRETDGFMLNSIDLTSTSIDDLVNYILYNPSLKFSQGTYKNKITLDSLSMPESIYINGVTASGNMNVKYRFRTSVDNKTWGVWSDWYNYTETHSISENINELAKYFEYEITLFGNEYFGSPICSSDITCRYYKPSDFVIFFKQIGVGGYDSANKNDYSLGESRSFISSVHATHEAYLPETSIIQYGVTQSNSNDFDNYYTSIDPDEHTIMLTRYNEPLITKDKRIYTALNGSWPDGVDVSVYKSDVEDPDKAILVDRSEYAYNHIDGTVTFYNTQNGEDSFLICIEVLPTFRLACKITNYGSSNAIIHHIGVIYNMMKRIPTDSDGNIIHTTIGSRIT